MRTIKDKIKSSKQLQTILALVVLFLFGAAVYANTLPNELFWDDDDGIVKNVYIKDWDNFPKFFTGNLIEGANLVSNYWRPMLLTVYATEYSLWGLNPAGYHVVNALVHIANAFLIFFLLKRLFKRQTLAFLTALIFLIHPLQTEAVTYVSGLGDPLSTMFILSGIILFLRFRDSGKVAIKSIYYWLAILMNVFALLTKEVSFVMPAMIILADFFYFEKGVDIKMRLKKILKVIWPFILLVGIYIGLRLTILDFQNILNVYNEETVFTENFHVRLFTFFKVLLIYIGLLFWPATLYMERSVDIETTLLSFPVMGGGVLTIVMLATALWQIKKNPILSFGILWFFIKLFPNTNLLVPNSAILYEHWLYLPMVGIWLIVVWLGLEVYKQISRKWRTNSSQIAKGLIVSALVIAVIGFSARTIDRNQDWRDPITFYNQTLQHAQPTYRIVNNLGMAYANQGDWRNALHNYQKAVNLNPEVSVAYHNMANAYQEVGNLPQAEQYYKTALQKDPRFIFSYPPLANIYLAQKKYPEAIEVLEAYLKFSPNNYQIRQLIEQLKAI